MTTVVTPEGPLLSGNLVCMGYWYQGSLYVLTDQSGVTPKYEFRDAIVIKNGYVATDPNVISKMVQFMLLRETGTISFQQQSPNTTTGNGLTYTIDSTTGDAVATRGTASSLEPTQTAYQDWGGNALMLANVPYSIMTNDDNQRTLKFYVKGLDDPQPVQPQMIPMSFYNPCKKGYTCYLQTNPPAAVGITYCSLIGLDGTGVCSSITTDTWTNLDDAKEQKVYNYCPPGTNCGTSCKSPCTDSTQTCTWYSGKDEFSCSSSGGGVFGGAGTFWTSTTFIAILIISAIIIFIVVVILGFLVYNKRKKSKAQAV